MTTGDRITRAEAAERLGVSVQTVDRFASSGLLTRHKNRLTNRVTFDAREVEHLRAERESPGTG